MVLIRKKVTSLMVWRINLKENRVPNRYTLQYYENLYFMFHCRALLSNDPHLSIYIYIAPLYTLGRLHNHFHIQAPTKWGCWSWIALPNQTQSARWLPSRDITPNRTFVCFVFVVFIWSSILLISFISPSHVMQHTHTHNRAVSTSWQQ